MSDASSSPILVNRWLAEQEARGLRRRLRRAAPGGSSTRFVHDGRQEISFAGNDYLGLAHHPALIEALCEGAMIWGVGAGSSALVAGHTEAHAALEADLAEFLGFPAARVFTSGYAANLAVITAFSREAPTVVFADKLVHASLVDALQLARAAGARVRRYPHRDLCVLARWLEEAREPVKLVVTDGVFSMDGDLAPLRELSALTRAHGAWLITDDAHGIGVLGPDGRGSFAEAGLVPEAHWLWVATFGKALGAAGAAILGPTQAIEWLDQAARTHVFTTAMPPALAHAVRTALRLVREEAWRRTRLTALIRHWRQAAEPLFGTDPSPADEHGTPAGAATLMPRMPFSRTPIQPLILGAAELTLRVERHLHEAGFFVPAIRPPTVPQGTSRLRISLCAEHTFTEVDALLQALRDSLARFPSFSRKGGSPA